MRLDNLPQSDRIEDRRGGRSGGLRGARSGGIGIGTVVVCSVSSVGHWVLIRASSFRAPTCYPKPVNPNKSRQPNQALRPMLRVGLSPRFLVAQRRNGPTFSLKLGKSTNRQRWSCFPEQPSRVAGLRNRLWVRSIVPLIRKCTLTRVSFRISSDVSALAMSACPEPVGTAAAGPASATWNGQGRGQ